MKKIILAILAFIFVVCGNSSIVGEWLWWENENNYGGIVFNTDGTGYSWYEDINNSGSKTEIISWSLESENTIFIAYKSNTGTIYKGTSDFYIIGDKLFFCEDDECDEYTRKDPNSTAISGKQKLLAKNNFQISRNSNSLNLNFADNSQKRIEIVNLQGKALKQTSFSAKNTSVDISNLPKGVFVLRVFENGKVNSVKFVRE
jgi:hypothetical protein